MNSVLFFSSDCFLVIFIIVAALWNRAGHYIAHLRIFILRYTNVLIIIIIIIIAL